MNTNVIDFDYTGVLCNIYKCNNCGCEFCYPIKIHSDSATEDSSVKCPKCGHSQ